MDLINFITDTDFGLETKTDNFEGWNVRQAVRAVLFNDKNEVALMHIGKYDVYKLPGGGVDQGEDLETAFVRELLEETGCEADKTHTIGIVIEKRYQWTMCQISYCFIAKGTKVKGLELTDSEKLSGFSLKWVKSIDEAIKLMEASESEEYDYKYIKKRDYSILKRAKEILK